MGKHAGNWPHLRWLGSRPCCVAVKDPLRHYAKMRSRPQHPDKEKTTPQPTAPPSRPPCPHPHTSPPLQGKAQRWNSARGPPRRRQPPALERLRDRESTRCHVSAPRDTLVGGPRRLEEHSCPEGATAHVHHLHVCHTDTRAPPAPSEFSALVGHASAPTGEEQRPHPRGLASVEEPLDEPQAI